MIYLENHVEEMLDHVSDLITNFDVNQLDYVRVAEASGCKYSKEDNAILIDMHETYLTPEKIKELETQYNNVDFSSYIEDLFSIQDNVLHEIAEEISSAARNPIYYFNTAFGIYTTDIDFKFDFFCESYTVAISVVEDFFKDLKEEEYSKTIDQRLKNGETIQQIIEDYFHQHLDLVLYQYISIIELKRLIELVESYYLEEDEILQRIEKHVKKFLDSVKDSSNQLPN
jgi:hypothetical protein